jgi:hypothetical protein
MNTLIIIGSIGFKRCYFNISEQEAIARYIKDEDSNLEFVLEHIDSFTFNDEFCAYDAWNY